MATTYDPSTADVGTVQKIDRNHIIIDVNVRKDIRLDKSFISSIRVRGFEQLPVGYLDEDDKAHITVGQRRVSAALEIGWDVVPLVIKSKVDAEADRTEELRILTQLAENEQRAPLSDAERVAGYKQLALLGVTEDQIARKTNAPKQHVTTALAIAASDTASKVLEAAPITLDQAAMFVEFEDDIDAIAQMTEIAAERPEQLAHTAERIRRDRQEKQLVDELAAQLEQDGWAIVHSKYSYGYDRPAGSSPVRELCREDDKKKTPLTIDDVAGLPGRVAVVFVRYGTQADAAYFLKNPAKHGFTALYSSGTGKGPLTDAEKEARRQKRTDKADMTAATEVRRAWITDLLCRKKFPDDTHVWTAHAITQTSSALGYNQRDDRARELAADWLGITSKVDSNHTDHSHRKSFEQHITTHPTEAHWVILAYAIALAEETAGDVKHHQFGQNSDLAPYFLQLQAWGYTLADVEQRIVDAAAKRTAKK